MEYLSELERVARALAESGQPGPGFAALEGAAARLIGHRMFTVLLYRPDPGDVERIHSSRPQAYPVGGRKAPRRDRWSETVLDRGEILLANSAEEVRAIFADHEKLESIGCRAVMCLPVRWDGAPLGTVNLSNEAGAFTEEHKRIGRVLAAFAVPGLLAARNRG